MKHETIESLATRLAVVEAELRQLKQQREPADAVPGWQQLVGSHEGSEEFAEIVELGRKIRQADRVK